MYMKTQEVIGNRRICPNLYVAKGKGFIAMVRVRGRERGKSKNEGISQNVIENTYRRNVGVRVCHNVYEKK
jgi:hypothetical protein